VTQDSHIHVFDQDDDAREALAYYPAPLRAGRLVRLDNHGGFSGANLFHVEYPGGPLCLRAWPANVSRPQHVESLHRLQGVARDRGLSFVPRVFATTDGLTVVWHAGRCWELQEWMPGRADFHEHPSAARLENACIALARLHDQWDRGNANNEPCPAVQRRLKALRQWANITGVGAPLRTVVERAERALPHWLGHLDSWLQPWTTRLFRLHPCLCDVWHDHVLFEGERVSGIIDYGAMKVDHAAVDLARMLGSLIEDDDAAWRVGLAAYRSVRPLSAAEERLARVLDVSGTVLGAANWLRRIAAEKRTEQEQAAVARRLEILVGRLERWEKQTPLAALH
jgi:Ser/Thr protein kinase RdoA (MazF antagonist)